MSTQPHTAMVFAAGFGTRMRPITEHTPKPLVPVRGKPLLAHRLDKLAEYGIQRVIINTHYLAEQIADYIAQHQQNSSCEIILSHEEEILETGGGLVQARPHLGDAPIFVINSDVIWLDGGAPALARLAQNWHDEMDIFMLLHPVARAIGYHGRGDFDMAPGGRLTRRDHGTHPYVFTGIQLLDPTVLDGRDAAPFSLGELFLETRQNNTLYGTEHTGEWLHIDSPDALEEAEGFLRNYNPADLHTNRL